MVQCGGFDAVGGCVVRRREQGGLTPHRMPGHCHEGRVDGETSAGRGPCPVNGHQLLVVVVAKTRRVERQAFAAEEAPLVARTWREHYVTPRGQLLQKWVRCAGVVPHHMVAAIAVAVRVRNDRELHAGCSLLRVQQRVHRFDASVSNVERSVRERFVPEDVH